MKKTKGHTVRVEVAKQEWKQRAMGKAKVCRRTKRGPLYFNMQ